MSKFSSVAQLDIKPWKNLISTVIFYHTNHVLRTRMITGDLVIKDKHVTVYEHAILF